MMPGDGVLQLLFFVSIQFIVGETCQGRGEVEIAEATMRVSS